MCRSWTALNIKVWLMSKLGANRYLYSKRYAGTAGARERYRRKCLNYQTSFPVNNSFVGRAEQPDKNLGIPSVLHAPLFRCGELVTSGIPLRLLTRWKMTVTVMSRVTSSRTAKRKQLQAWSSVWLRTVLRNRRLMEVCRWERETGNLWSLLNYCNTKLWDVGLVTSLWLWVMSKMFMIVSAPSKIPFTCNTNPPPPKKSMISVI